VQPGNGEEMIDAGAGERAPLIVLVLDNKELKRDK
jgi:hypothetical protein